MHALFAFLMVGMVPLNWHLEVRADRFAVDVAGKASTISALLAIVTREEIEMPSEDHPSVSERVKEILKYRPKETSIH